MGARPGNRPAFTRGHDDELRCGLAVAAYGRVGGQGAAGNQIDRPRLTRREAIGLLGAGAVAAAGPLAQAAQQARPAYPKGAVIRTLLKDLPPESVRSGSVLFHEHLSMRYPLGATEHFTDDVALMIEETRAAGTDGVAAIVDGGHDDMVRNMDALQRIARESGVHVIASGGYYMQRTYPADLAAKSVDTIADELAREAIARRYGAFGEIGQQGGVMTDDERKVFQAVAKAQVRTGLPIFTHNAYTGMRVPATPVPRDTAITQLDLLESAGARAANLAIGHVCCLDDPKAEIAQQIAKRGAFVGFDRVTIPLVPDAQKVTTIVALVEAGYAANVLLSSDFSSARALKKNGGPGIAQTATVFGPMLLEAGISESELRQILVDNPKRFLAFVPK
jgi:phosphotriesterase-related protein